MKNKTQQKAYQLVFWQLMGVALLAGLMLIFRGYTSGLSVFLGGCAYGLPNLLLVWLAFRFTGAQQASFFAATFFIGEMLKLFLSTVLFLLIVKYGPVSLLSVLIGFVGAIVSFWIACLWHFTRAP